MPFIGTFDHGDAATAVTMIDPDLTGTERAGRREMLARRDVGTVWGPVRVIQQPKRFLRQLTHVAAVGRHDPYVVATPRVADVSDLGSIG